MTRSTAQDEERGRLLDELAALLKRAPMTATEVAREMGCSKATAYARIRALPKRGYKMVTGEVSGRSGPMSAVYHVIGRTK